MKIVDKHSLVEIMQINYDFGDIGSDIVAMYATLSLVMIRESNPEALLKLLLEMRSDNMDEYTMLKYFLQDYIIQIEDTNDTITKAVSVSDIFGK